eukprot:10776558-Alexandrium_andersonii.AAC.1
MSASLVGSEMCIRDRTPEERRLRRGIRRAQEARLLASTGCALPRGLRTCLLYTSDAADDM